MTTHWHPAYIGLGSNLDEPEVQIGVARQSLENLPNTRVCAHSALYQTSPMGPSDQPDFVNAATSVLTQLDAHSLLGHLQAIEIAQGRVRDRERWGPRRIDLDLLVFGRLQFTDANLQVPHPGIPERNFVLLPLLDVAPQLVVPGLATVTRLYGQLPADAAAIRRLD